MNNFFNHIHEANVYRFLSGGLWQESISKKTLEVISPIDQSVIGKVQDMTVSEIDSVITNARAAQIQWRVTDPSDRAAILKKAASLLREQIETVALMQVMEVGKLVSSSRKEIERTADIIDYTADQLSVVNDLLVLEGEDFAVSAKNKQAMVFREPHGVVLAISPFNYPVNLAVTKIAPALMMGNSVVLKGPLQGAISTLMLVEIFNQAGIPSGVISAVTGDSSEIGDFLVSHTGVDMVSFTGSTAVGKHIISVAGCKPLQLELGGKDAALVFPDADLDRAALEIVSGAFSYAGQRCTAIKRVLVNYEVVEELTSKIAVLVRDHFQVVGDPRDPTTQMGPIISVRQAKYASELMEDAITAGARVVVGGEVRANYMDAFVLSGVITDMRIAWEEQFAPILPIISCADEDEMIELHNRSQYGLGASVFTQDKEKAQQISRQLQVGVVQINAKSERYPDHFPFLGVKDSGLGVQGVRWSLEAMSRIKSVVVNKR